MQGSNPRLCRGEAMNDRPNSFSLLGYFCSVDFWYDQTTFSIVHKGLLISI